MMDMFKTIKDKESHFFNVMSTNRKFSSEEKKEPFFNKKFVIFPITDEIVTFDYCFDDTVKSTWLRKEEYDLINHTVKEYGKTGTFKDITCMWYVPGTTGEKDGYELYVMGVSKN
jgi:hypothetical protein